MLNLTALCSRSEQSLLVDNILLELENKSDQLTIAQKLKLFIEALEIEKKDSKTSQTYLTLHTRFADFLINSGAHKKAIEHIQKAIRINKKLDGKEYYLFSMLGSLYLTQIEYDSSYYYYNLALEAAQNQDHQYTIAAACNNIGILFYKIEKYTIAKDYFYKSMKAYYSQNRIRDINFLTSIYDNLAELYLKTNQLDSSRAYYNLNHKIGLDSNISIRIVQSQLGLAESYLKENQLSKLFEVLNQTKIPLENLAKNSRYDGFKIQFEWLIYEYYNRSSRIVQATHQLDKFQKLQKIQENKKQIKLDQTLTDFIQSNTDRFETELNSKSILLKILKERNRLNTYINLLIIVIGGILFLLFYNNYKKKMLVLKKESELEYTKNQLTQIELKNTELEKTKLETELKYKEKDLENTALKARSELVINQEILDNLIRIQKLPMNTIPVELKKYVNNFYTLINNASKNKLVLENIEQLNQKFNFKLKEKFSTLTQNEVELCGFIKLSMSSKEISVLKNVSYESIKMAKTRLKKKFNLAQGDNLEDFINSI